MTDDDAPDRSIRDRKPGAGGRGNAARDGTVVRVTATVSLENRVRGNTMKCNLSEQRPTGSARDGTGVRVSMTKIITIVWLAQLAACSGGGGDDEHVGVDRSAVSNNSAGCQAQTPASRLAQLEELK